MRDFRVCVLCLSLLCCADPSETESDAQAGVTDDDAHTGSAQGDAEAQLLDAGEAARDAGASHDAATTASDARTESDARASADAGGNATDARVATDAQNSAPPGDAGVRGDSRCADAGLKFCDDFEADAIDTKAWEKIGSAELDSMNDPGRGRRSLHVHSTNDGFSGLVHRASFPFANERFWGRMLIKIKNLPTAPDWAHWTIMGASSEGSVYSSAEHRIGGQWHTENHWGVGTDHGPTGDWTNLDNSSPVQLDAWQCIEWLIDSDQDVSQLYRDGTEIKSLATALSTKHGGNSGVAYEIPAIRQLWAGFWFYQGSAPAKDYDVWIDSFALHSERIGCSR